MPKEIIIGTRDSKLAMWQAHWVKYCLENQIMDYIYTIKPIKTTGDKRLETPLAQIGDKGLFTKELEIALQNGEIHMAVHSMKDLPTSLPEGLLLGAVCRREMPNDVLISRQGLRLKDLPAGAVIGTGSLRRRAQLAYLRPDIHVADIRGNLNTRLNKLEDGLYDAVMLAWAGMKRLGLVNQITEIIQPNVCMPAVGQGALGIEIPAGNELLANIADKMDHPETRCAVDAERAFLRRLEGGCRVPLGALGTASMGRLLLEGVVAGLDGNKLLRTSVTGKMNEAVAVGELLAENMIKMGAVKLLEESRREIYEYDA
ncbi:MAG: hydroxymethylbilane synthase [Peptococcaceae bacterium]|nr:hydroxymethylbilane synthase [Peptococcaceae bacterium]